MPAPLRPASVPGVYQRLCGEREAASRALLSERLAVARDVLVDRARTVAGQDFDGVGGRAVELGPVDLVEAEQKIDSPFVKPGALELRSAFFDRDLVVDDRPAERLGQRLGHLEPCQPRRAAEDMTTPAL